MFISMSNSYIKCALLTITIVEIKHVLKKKSFVTAPWIVLMKVTSQLFVMVSDMSQK